MGDFSNSDRYTGDLPVCGQSYTVYHYNYGRSAHEAVHDHMHQLESMFSLINSSGTDAFQPGTDFYRFAQQTSCGNAHFPPNATQGYQYDSSTLVSSDCEDWKKSGGGQVQQVNVNTWLPASWYRTAEMGYYTWWMHNVPGIDNTAGMQSWWNLISDFDSWFPIRQDF